MSPGTNFSTAQLFGFNEINRGKCQIGGSSFYLLVFACLKGAQPSESLDAVHTCLGNCDGVLELLTSILMSYRLVNLAALADRESFLIGVSGQVHHQGHQGWSRALISAITPRHSQEGTDFLPRHTPG